MQDTRSGNLVPLRLLRDIPVDLVTGLPPGAAFVAAGEAAGIPRTHQGPVFRVGEEIEIKGGRFRVRSVGHKGLVLEGLPGTSVKRAL